MQPPSRPSSSLLPLLPPAAVALVAALVHSPGLFNQFLNWDDAQYVLYCIPVHAFTWENIRYFLTTPYFVNYHPITSFTYMGDHAVWGIDPTGWHLTNIVLHALNSVWVYFLALALLRPGKQHNEGEVQSADFPYGAIGAVTAALIFSLHPLRVEAAAWISGRKDLVCAAFFLPALWTWVQYIGAESRPGTWPWRPYLASLTLFFLALMSKPMAITLPIVLLLLDFFHSRPASVRLLVEKVPFFALSVVSALITFWAQTEGGALRDDLAYDWWVKARTVTYGFVFYIVQWLWPMSLSPLYSYGSPPHAILPAATTYAPFLFLALVTVAIISARRSRLWALAWGMYFIMLLPVAQFIPIGNAYAADRYTYLPMVGLAVALGAVLQGIVRKQGLRSPTTALTLTATAALLGFWASQSIRYTRAWRTDNTLWTHTIRHHPSSDAYGHLASDQYRSFQPRKALDLVDQALVLNPRNSGVYNTRGNAMMMIGEMDGAVQAFQTATTIDPKSAFAYTNGGHALIQMKRYEEAVTSLDRALEISPNLALALLHRATARERLGRTEQALEDLEKAAARAPKLDAIPLVRARILIQKNQIEEARVILRALHAAGTALPDDLQAIFQEPSAKQP